MRRALLSLPLLFAPAEVPRLADPGSQLALARERKQALVGLDGPARERARVEAVDAYRAVREHHPRARAAVAEAAFRAGELLRAGGDRRGAALEFTLAAAEGGGTAFRARARLELGHLARRARDGEGALDAYLAVLADPESCDHHRDEALFWSGRVHAEAGRAAEARRAFERVAEDARDPADRVRAFDELGLARLRAGDPEAAAGEWNRCRLALAEAALEETETGARVRAALASMRTLRALRDVARARAERARAREERGRSGEERR